MRVTLAVCGVILAFFVVETVANNAPLPVDSVASRALAPFRLFVLHQNWRLFAPTTATYQHETLLEARYRSGGRVVTSPPTDVERAADDLIRTNRVLPSKMAAYPLAFEHMEAILGTDSKKSTRDKLLAQTLLSRFGSLYADTLYPGDQITDVRIIMVETPLRHTGQPAPRHPRRYVSADSGWMPYVAGVGR